ncbi:MAG: hypothetical protein K2I06_02560 [Ruminococcus sp.]|nr:hypothetical protein [Ruminococcus sp.]
MNKKIISIISGVAVFLGAALTVFFNLDNKPDDISASDSLIAETSVSETEAEISTESVIESITENESETVTETITEAVTEIFSEETTEYFTDNNNYVEYHFRNEKLLNQHFEKHGSEFYDDFGYQNAQEYEKGASDVINNPDALFKYEAEDGDGVYYIEQSNEFVILSTDGYIRTYFRPSGRIDYFNRQ